MALAVAAVFVAGSLAAVPANAAPQASITLKDCNSALCYANNTDWTLTKTPALQSITLPNDPPTISWTVTATRVATSDNFLKVDGIITVTNTGTANATIGNIVVNLQKPRTGPNT